MPPAKAKLFMNGRSQAVRLPKEFQMPGTEVYIRREGNDIILSTKPRVLPRTLGEFLEMVSAHGGASEEFERSFYEAKEARAKYERENPKPWLVDPNWGKV